MTARYTEADITPDKIRADLLAAVDAGLSSRDCTENVDARIDQLGRLMPEAIRSGPAGPWRIDDLAAEARALRKYRRALFARRIWIGSNPRRNDRGWEKEPLRAEDVTAACDALDAHEEESTP